MPKTELPIPNSSDSNSASGPGTPENHPHPCSSPPDLEVQGSVQVPPPPQAGPTLKSQTPFQKPTKSPQKLSNSLEICTFAWPKPCAHPVPWKPAHTFWRRITQSNKQDSSQTKAQCIPQRSPKADWPRRATRSFCNKPKVPTSQRGCLRSQGSGS